MQILTETFGDVLVAHAPDELTDDVAHLVANTLKRAAEAGQSRVVLQMDRTDGFDSAGLTVLLDLHDLLRQMGGGIKVCGLTDTGRKVFEITRLERRFELFESLVDAVGSFR
jgi:anti-sigma B factor antagonist